MKALIKVQRPLASNMGEPSWLIYDEGRLHRELRPANEIPVHVRKVMHDRTKAYFEAEWNEDRQGWHIGQPAAPQAW